MRSKVKKTFMPNVAELEDELKRVKKKSRFNFLLKNSIYVLIVVAALAVIVAERRCAWQMLTQLKARKLMLMWMQALTHTLTQVLLYIIFLTPIFVSDIFKANGI